MPRPSPRLLPVLAVLVLMCGGAAAEPVAATVRSEIDALLARLASSGCVFNRNGAWHDAAAARAHLLDKLAQLERRRLVRTTEQFIERAASGSSASGKPYLVKCGDAAPVESGTWLSAELRSLRGARSDNAPTWAPERAREMAITRRLHST